MQTIEIIKEFDAPIGEVFGFFSDHARLGEIWPGQFQRIKDSENPNNPNGVGSVRRVSNYPVTLEETVSRYEVNRLIEYYVSAGLPLLKHHKGTMRFGEFGGKTVLSYTIELDFKLPGMTSLIRTGLESALRKGINKLGHRFVYAT